MLDENILMGITVYGGVILASFWLALIIWAYRDMRARSRDSLAHVLVALVIAILNIPGVFIYIMLRPRETLAESYERSLEEEALLQEIEEKPACPGCGQRVQHNWQACPYCHTRLKKMCHVCKHPLDLSWNLCPHCASPQNQHQPDDQTVNVSRHVQRTAPQMPTIPDKWLNPNSPSNPDIYTNNQDTAQSLEFIDNDEY